MNNITPVYISLGSNINSLVNLNSAIRVICSELHGCQVSSIYQSPAVGMQGDDFLNAVIGGNTTTGMDAMVSWLRRIEEDHGRVRSTNKFTDRPLDLDLLLFGDAVTQKLPHHDITEQSYVLQPLADVAAAVVHPVFDLPIGTLNDRLKARAPEKYEALLAVKLA